MVLKNGGMLPLGWSWLFAYRQRKSSPFHSHWSAGAGEKPTNQYFSLVHWGEELSEKAKLNVLVCLYVPSLTFGHISTDHDQRTRTRNKWLKGASSIKWPGSALKILLEIRELKEVSWGDSGICMLLHLQVLGHVLLREDPWQTQNTLVGLFIF